MQSQVFQKQPTMIVVTVLLVLCIIPSSHPSMETADVNVKPVSFDSNVVASLQEEGARQEDGDSSVTFQDPNLPPDHYQYYFNRRPDQAMACRLDKSCPYKDQVDSPACWGYESDCTRENMSGYPKMGKHLLGWFHSEEDQLKQFWTEGDFGYVKKILDEGFYQLCLPKTEGGASLACIDNTRSCLAKNLYVDLTNFDDPSKRRGRLDIDYFETPGIIGGHCSLDKKLLQKHSTRFSELQSWYGELKEFTPMASDPFVTPSCDVVIEGRVFLMKLDAGINMFHHFCDFVNLYITQHLMNDFSQNVTIVMWDMSNMRYLDLFQETWAAFSNRPLSRLNDWSGKKVCFREAVFTLPPRMIRGLFYNMPLTPNTHGGSLMRSFSQLVIHRLGVKQKGPLKSGKVRITILDRKSKHRNIINQDELVHALREDPYYDVQVVAYNHTLTFVQQMEITHNSDIFIGMHGAGLTHLLFLPDWATIFEICNCEDKHCYEDLASLRGVHYMTWQNNDLLKKHNEILHPNLGTYHAKFCDYSFGKGEFIRLVKEAQQHVESHPKFWKGVIAKRDEL